MEELGKYKKKLYRNYFLAFLVPPPAWFILNYLCGALTLDIIKQIISTPLIYLYVSSYIFLAYRYFRKNVLILHKSMLPGKSELEQMAGQKAFIALQRSLLLFLFLYVVIGPFVVMLPVKDQLSTTAFYISWANGVPLILLYSSPFIMGYIKNLALFSQNMTFFTHYRAFSLPAKLLLVLGQNMLGVVLIFPLFVYNLVHLYGHEDNFAQLILARVVLIALSLLVILVINLLVFNDSLTSSLKPLRDNMSKLASGTVDLRTRLGILTRDELGEIAYYFNQFMKVMQQLIQKSHQVIESLSDSSADLSRLSDNYTDSAKVQHAAIEEVSLNIRAMSESVEEINGQATAQNTTVKSLIGQLNGLDTIVEQMSEKLTHVTDLSESTADKARMGDEILQKTNASIINIDNSAAKIASVISLIRDISDQIDLLALNASIEAARAGESGKGFAVVADEVAKLAEQTSDSIKQIENLVRLNSNDVRSGVENVKNTIRIIGEIMSDTRSISTKIHELDVLMNEQIAVNESVQVEVQEVNNKAETIRRATAVQKESIESVTLLLFKIKQISQKNTEAAQRLAKDARENEIISQELQQNVGTFTF